MDGARERGATLVATLHQVDVALAHFPRIVGLRGGQLAFMRRVAALEINTCPHGRKGRLCLVQLLAPQAAIAPHRAAVRRGPP